jgi:hypothetical protein
MLRSGLPTRALRVLLAVGALLVVVVLGAAPSMGAFAAQKANPSNSFTAASTFARMRVATGTYTGNAVDNRAITGVGFQPDVVIVKADAAQIGVIRSSSMSGDTSKPMTGATALTANLVQTLDSNGFTLGNDARVNGNGTTYYWVAFKAQAGELKVGSYTGNGAASRAIIGAGFSPEYAMVLPATGQQAVERATGMSSTFRFDAETGAANRINSLDSDGFTVGSSAQTNTSGTTYHYLLWNEMAGNMDVGSYTGTAVANRQITGVGFQPAYVMIRANDIVTARKGIQRPAAESGSNALAFDGTAAAASRITALGSDGFTLGTDANVNALATSYSYMAFKDGS